MNNTGIWITVGALVVLALIAWWIFSNDGIDDGLNGTGTTTTEMIWHNQA